MQLLSAIAPLLLRLVWWIGCIPFELVRALVIIPLVIVVRACTNKMVARIVVIAVLFYYWCRVAPMDQTDYTIASMLIGFAMIAASMPETMRKMFPFPVKAGWRRALRMPAKARKNVDAAIVIRSFSDASETRARMTARLSPNVQALLKPVRTR